MAPFDHVDARKESRVMEVLAVAVAVMSAVFAACAVCEAGDVDG
jgi:hypothetical protein